MKRRTAKKKTRPAKNKKTRLAKNLAVDAVPVSATELRALKAELERRMRSPAVRPKPPREKHRRTGPPVKPAPLRWNPDPDDVQRSVAQLVLTIVEFLRLLMERQAIRRMENKTLTKQEVEAVGQALMRLEQTVKDIGKRFGLAPEDLNLDLGPVKLI